MEKPKPKVLICLPTMGSVHVLLMVTLLKWVADAAQSGKVSLLIYPSVRVQPVDNARNHLVEEFLKTDCTHLFFIDSDTVPPPTALMKLLAADKDIVSGITPIVDYDDARKDSDSNGFYKKWNCVNWSDKHVNPNTGMVKIKGAGSSCILIKRHVFEKLPAPWYQFKKSDDQGKPADVGEDIYFTACANGADMEVYADTSVICKHEKSILW